MMLVGATLAALGLGGSAGPEFLSLHASVDRTYVGSGQPEPILVEIRNNTDSSFVLPGMLWLKYSTRVKCFTEEEGESALSFGRCGGVWPPKSSFLPARGSCHFLITLGRDVAFPAHERYEIWLELDIRPGTVEASKGTGPTTPGRLELQTVEVVVDCSLASNRLRFGGDGRAGYRRSRTMIDRTRKEKSSFCLEALRRKGAKRRLEYLEGRRARGEHRLDEIDALKSLRRMTVGEFRERINQWWNSAGIDDFWFWCVATEVFGWTDSERKLLLDELVDTWPLSTGAIRAREYSARGPEYLLRSHVW